MLSSLKKYLKDANRPLLFIAHSFGGHVVMYTLRHSFDNPAEGSNPFASTAGLIFLGTPFRGRHGIILDEMLKRINRHNPDYQIWQDTMEQSVAGNPFLRNIVEKFLETRGKRRQIPIVCFYEELPSPLVKVLESKDPEQKVSRFQQLTRLEANYRFRVTWYQRNLLVLT